MPATLRVWLAIRLMMDEQFTQQGAKTLEVFSRQLAGTKQTRFSMKSSRS